jgi:hypothetical protein
MYKIFTSKHKDAKVEIRLDRIPAGLVPRSVFLGVGDKAKRYEAFLEKAFTDNQELLRLMAYIHLQGSKLGDVALITDPRLKQPYHAACVKAFLEKNVDFLSQIVPYLFPGEKIAGAEGANAEIPEELKNQLGGGMASTAKTLNDLPSVDRDQIMALIQEDQAKEAAQRQDVSSGENQEQNAQVSS